MRLDERKNFHSGNGVEGWPDPTECWWGFHTCLLCLLGGQGPRFAAQLVWLFSVASHLFPTRLKGWNLRSQSAFLWCSVLSP